LDSRKTKKYAALGHLLCVSRESGASGHCFVGSVTGFEVLHCILTIKPVKLTQKSPIDTNRMSVLAFIPPSKNGES
jgi:hypothetical protein